MIRGKRREISCRGTRISSARSSRQLRRDTIPNARSRKITKLICYTTPWFPSDRRDAICPLLFSPFSASYANFVSPSSSLSPTVNDNIRSLNRRCPRIRSQSRPSQPKTRNGEFGGTFGAVYANFQACTYVVLSDF